MILYRIIQLTWGLPLNIIGAIAYFVLVNLFGFKIYKYRNMICAVVPWNFGGLNLGMFAIIGENCLNLLPHEYGHSIQNLFWGWLTPLVITLPSAVRYWYREIQIMRKIPLKTKYDDTWFEGQATALGTKAEKNSWSWL